MPQNKNCSVLIIGLLLFLMILFGCIPMTLSYAEGVGGPAIGVGGQSAEGEAVLSAEDISAKAGETVEVNVRIAGNPGIIGTTLVVDYDSRLELAGVMNGTAFRCLDMTRPGELKPGCKIHWDGTDAANSEVEDGVVVVLSFVVPANAADGDIYPLSVSPDYTNGEIDAFDRDLNVVNLKPAAGRIVVGSEAGAHVHSYGAWKEVKPATCSEAGLRERVCAGCGESLVQEIAPLQHYWDAGEVTKEATENEPGAFTYKCIRCGQTKVEVIPAHGVIMPALIADDVYAQPGELVTVEVKIEGNPGIIGATFEVTFDSRLTLVSVDCGDAFRALDMTKPGELKSGCRIHWDTTDIPITDIQDGTVVTLGFMLPEDAGVEGSYSINVSAVVENGQIDVYDYDVRPVDLLPAQCSVIIKADSSHQLHTYGAWVVVKEPTCTEAGSREKRCSICGNTVVETIEPLNHVWDTGVITTPPTCTALGLRTYSCMRDGCTATRTEAVSALEHEWGDWVVVRNPTQIEFGLKQRICAHDARHVESELIDKLGSDGDQDTTDQNGPDSDGGSGNPGDNSGQQAENGSNSDSPADEADGSGSGGSPSEQADPAKDDPATYAGKATAAGFSDLAAGAWYMSEGFKDDSGKVVATYLDYTIGRGLMSGYTGERAGQFGPDDALSRGMAATIIYRMATGATAGTTDNAVDAGFADVGRGEWYAAAVKWCAEKGVVTGYAGTGRFGPDDRVTREQLAAMVFRYCTKVAGMAPAGGDVSRFPDGARIAEWARAAAAFCAEHGVITGRSDTGAFDPQGDATRCQMAKIIAVTARLAG